jgi:hypothetical protein
VGWMRRGLLPRLRRFVLRSVEWARAGRITLHAEKVLCEWLGSLKP